jgi:hypothetical protein
MIKFERLYRSLSIPCFQPGVLFWYPSLSYLPLARLYLKLYALDTDWASGQSYHFWFGWLL